MPSSSTLVRVLRFGLFEVDLRSGELRKAGVRVKLHDQPFQVLTILIDRAGELVTREEIRKTLWPGDTFVDFDHGLNNAVNRLREALGDSADKPRFIETLSRRGYRFIGTINESREIETALPVPPVPATPQESGRLVPERRNVRRARYAWILWLVAVLAAIFAGMNLRSFQSRSFQTLASESKRSIAVLPFENLTGDANQEYFVDGMTDALITNLSKLGALRVISRTSAMHYKGTHKALPEIAHELNVNSIVEGSVARSGNRVRISAQLVVAANDQSIWVRDYNRNLQDVLQLQNELAMDVAQQVAGKLTPKEQSRLAARTRPVNPEAYEADLKGEYFLTKWSTEGFEKAKQYFEQSIILDPTYSQGYAGLGEYYSIVAFLGAVPSRENYLKAEDLSRKALEIDETLVQPYVTLGMVKLFFRCDPAGAEKDLNRALELDPGSVYALDYHSYYLLKTGRTDEAISEKRRVVKHDPLAVEASSELGMYLSSVGRNDEAIQQLRKALEIDANHAATHVRLADAYTNKQQYSEAIAELKKAIALEKMPAGLAQLGDIYARSGKKQEARAVISELIEMSKRSYVSPTFIASVHARLGERGVALRWLEKARANDGTPVSDSAFDTLRSDPRFKALEAQLTPNQSCPPRVLAEQR